MRSKQFIRRITPLGLYNFFRGILYPEKIDVLEERVKNTFLTYYENLKHLDLDQKKIFRNAEFKVYSKHGCDGILAHLFSKIGIASHTFVEIGVEDGRECNTANLSLNFGWQGLLVDGNALWIESAKKYYKEKLGNKSNKVKSVASFVTAENINKLLISEGVSGEIDLLSIDIDSNDYWVWKAINEINPRVVVIEYNAAFGMRSIVIKYNSDPSFHDRKERLYFGASLPALTRLAKEKGYILIACDCHGHDAYFVRKDVVNDRFKELSPEEAFYPNPYTLMMLGSLEKQFDSIKHLDFEKI